MAFESTPPALSEVLSEHGEFVRTLARRLVGGDEAEDVAQETFVRLIEHPPGHGGNLRAWLVTVTRNLVRARGQARARRRGREEDVARPERLPSVAQELEQAELVKLVVASAMELDEPYRETILCRFLRDWSVARTAETLGVPAATVRSREQRALELLRGKLDRHFDSRHAWVGLLLTTLRLAPAPVGAPVPPPRAGVLAWSVGLVAVATLGTWLVTRGGAARPALALAELDSGSTQVPPSDVVHAPIVGAQRAALPAPTSSAPVVAELGEIRGRLRTADGAPAAGVRVALHGWLANRERELLHGSAEWSDLASESDDQGVFSFHFDPPGAFQFAIEVDDERFAVLSWRIRGLARGARHDLGSATLEPAGTVEGRLVDEQGRPVTGRSVFLTLERQGLFGFDSMPDRSDDPLYAFVSSADGSFRFTRVPSGDFQLRLEEGLVEHPGPRVQLAPGATERVDVPCPPLDSTLALAVHVSWQHMPLSMLGAPAADLRLFGPAGETYTPDAYGRFTELGPGPYRLELAHPWFEPVVLADLEPGRKRAILLRGSSRARLVFLLPEGAAGVPERVLVRYPTSGRQPDFFVAHEGEAPLLDGVVGGLIPGDAELCVRLSGLGERRVALPALAAGETRTVTLDFTRATALAGRVQHADGEPLDGIEVALLVPAQKDDSPASHVVVGPPSSSPYDPWRRVHARVLTDAEGRYRFDLVAGGRFALQVEPPAGPVIASEAFELAQDALVMRDVLVPRTVELTGRVTGPRDLPLERLRLWACPAQLEGVRNHDPGLETAVALEPDGRFRMTRTAGEWRLLIVLPADQLWSDARMGGLVAGTRELGRVTLVEDQPTEVELSLGAQAPVRQEFVLHANGEPAFRACFTLRDELGFDVQSQTGRDGRARMWLFPGEYSVTAGTSDWSVSLGNHVVASSTPGERRFDIELVRARLRFLDADGTARARQQIGLFLPSSGGDGWSPFRGKEADDEGALEFTLVPGRYGFALGLQGPDRVVVPLDWTATGPLVDELRL